MNSRFRVNAPDVSHEIFDGEVVIINLATGNYYSLRESAVAIWSLLAAGHGVEAAARSLSARYAIDAAAARATVTAFAAQLESLGLLVPDATGAEPAAPPPAGAPEPFSEPVLDAYTDMRELLLLDPVHQTDVTGWPAKPPAP